MKNAITSLIVFLLIGILNAAPLKKVPVRLTQPNGEIISCFVSGDEFYNYYHDSNGFLIKRNPQTGFFVYTKNQTPSEFLVNKINPKSVDLDNIVTLDEPTLNRRNIYHNQLNYYRARINKSLSTGVLTNLVIFIRFSDETEFLDGFNKYDNVFNSDTSNSESFKNYIHTVSYKKLSVTSVFFPTPINNDVRSYQGEFPRNYYKQYDSVTNPIGYQDNKTERLNALLIEAINAIKDSVSPNLNLDMNNDGYVDNICFVIRGQPEGWLDALWPHAFIILGDIRINDKSVQAYNLQLENWIDYSVLSHEFLRTLGAPDLYRYSYSGAPVGDWDIMASGRGHPSAHVKYKYLGWIDSISVINNTGSYSLKPLTIETNNVYKIFSPYAADSEFFYIEYRRKNDIFENVLPSSGMIVYRIKNDLQWTIGNRNGPPDEVYIFRPNGNSADEGDLNLAAFSRDFGRDYINDNSNPSSFLTDGSPGGLNVSNIGGIDDEMSFDISIVISSIQEKTNVPDVFYLSQNYPNPFNPSTTIGFTIPEREHVNLVVSNSLGQEVRTLLNGEEGKGSHEVRFDASALPSGIYFFRLRAGSFVETKKLVLLK